MYFNSLFIYIVNIIHIIVVSFIIITPFSNSNYFLLFHVIIVPFIVFHWVVNNNTCALTLAEQYIRKRIYGSICNTSETFIGKIIEPIYDFKSNCSDLSDIIYIGTFLLWAISLMKLVAKYNRREIRTLKDLIRI